jgi:hypothetical protein
MRLATEWQTVLGAPPARERADLDDGHAKAKYAAWLKVLVDAPDTIEEAIKREPTVASLVDQLYAQSPRFQSEGFGMRLLSQHEIYRTMMASARGRLLATTGEDRIRQFGELFNDPTMAKAWPVLLSHVRRRVLLDEYRMEPERMMKFTLDYGPIDWRHPASHGLYWSRLGVDMAMVRWTEKNKGDFDFVNTGRITAQSVQELFRSGEIYFDYFAAVTGAYSTWQGVPNVNFADAYGVIVEEMREVSWADQQQRAYSVLTAGYENFVRDLICYFFRRGQLATAERWYTHLRTWERRNINDPYRADLFAKPIAEFVEIEMKDRYTSPYMAVQQVMGALDGAFASGLLGNDTDLFRDQFLFANTVHRYYLEEQLRSTPAGGELRRMQLMDPDFRMVSGIAFLNFLSNLSLDEAEATYTNAPEELKTWALMSADQPGGLRDRFGPAFADDKGITGARTFDQVFFKPPNFDSIRAEIMARLEARRSETLKAEQK